MITADQAKAGAIIVGVAAVGFVAWKVYNAGLRDTAKNAASSAVGVISGTATGIVEGIGLAVGIPVTEETKCRAAIAAENTWDVSFYCDVGTFARYLTGTLPPTYLGGTYKDQKTADLFKSQNDEFK